MKKGDLFNRVRYGVYNIDGKSVYWSVDSDKTEKTIFLMFFCSYTAQNWLSNFDFPVKPYKKQQSTLCVAHGWATAYKSCNDKIMEKLIAEVKNNPAYKVLISGWSFGGVMAQLAAEDFNFRTGNKADVITFGSPKPFFGKKTKTYVQNCCKSAVNYTHVNDIVSFLPPFLGYHSIDICNVGNKNEKFRLKDIGIYHLMYGNNELYGE